MKTSQRQISESEEERLTSSPEASPASLFPTQGSEADERTSVTSGRRCCGLLTKSGPLGSLVRTLLESPLWSKEGYSLRWEATPLCSERVTDFTDTSCGNPSPSSEYAETLRVLDTPSSRCLFRLRLSALPTEETGSSLLPMPEGETLSQEIIQNEKYKCLFPTPRACRFMAASLEGEGIRSEKSFPNLEVVIARMLPTPTARDEKNPSSPNSSPKTGGGTFRLSPLFTEEMMGFPFLWTALPFLQFPSPQHTGKEAPSNIPSASGEPNPSKPTETP